MPLGYVRVLSRVLSRVLQIMSAIGRCQCAVQDGVQGSFPACSRSCLPSGGVRALSRVLCPGALLRGAVEGAWDHVSQGAVQGAVQGAPDQVCYWGVSVCCEFKVFISICGPCWCNFLKYLPR